MHTRSIVNYHRCLALLCVMPYSPHRRHQVVQKIYMLLVLIKILSIAVYGLYNFENRKNDLLVSLSAAALVFLMYTASLTVVICEMLTTYNQHVEFISKMHCLGEKFSLLNSESSSTSIKLYKYAWIIGVIFANFAVYILVALHMHYYGFFGYSFPSIVILYARFLQITVLADVIQVHLKALNVHLNKITKTKSLQLESSIYNVDIYFATENSVKRLLALKNIYTKISDIVELFNAMFGWSIVSIVVSAFLNITLNLYWFILSSNGFYPRNLLYFIVTTLVSYTWIMFVFCYNCEQLRRSVRITASLVKKLIGITEADYNAVACEFSLQIDGNPLYITANRFFNVDFELLTALVAQIASIMVILVQFSFMEFEKRGVYRALGKPTNQQNNSL